MELGPSDRSQLEAADGWLRLGNVAEAQAELAKIPPPFDRHPEVSQARYRITAMQGDWDGCLRIADELISQRPGERFGWLHRAQSLHRLQRTQEAYETLAKAVQELGPSPTISFFLACYAAGLGRLEHARDWLEDAFELAAETGDLDRLRKKAREAPELKPLWSELEDSSDDASSF